MLIPEPGTGEIFGQNGCAKIRLQRKCQRNPYFELITAVQSGTLKCDDQRKAETYERKYMMCFNWEIACTMASRRTALDYFIPIRCCHRNQQKVSCHINNVLATVEGSSDQWHSLSHTVELIQVDNFL